MTSRGKILIIRMSSLGDILHTLPAFQGLRAALPEVSVGWVVEPRARFLLDAVPGIDRIHILDTRSIRSSPTSLEALRGLLASLRQIRAEKYDTSIDFQGLIKTAVLSLASGAARRIGFPRELAWEFPAHWLYNRRIAVPPDPLHVVELNLRLAQMAGATAARGPLRLVTSQADTQAVEALLQSQKLDRFVVLNPGGGWPTKCWAPERYGQLAAVIEQRANIPVAVTTGPGEERMYEQIARHSAPATPKHLRVPFLQLIPLFERASLFVGGDTGPFHLACALGRPVVGIFGPTSPVRNGPWSPDDKHVVRRLPCSFCYGRSCPTSNECMDISVDEVWQAVEDRLQRERAFC